MAKKILIIDDDPSFSVTVGERLKFEGYKVIIAPDGDTGLDLAKIEKPDLIVLDVFMPKLNGYAFLKMLKNWESGKNIPVVICTASHDIMDAFKSEGITGFLVKPFDPAELIKMIDVSFRIGETSLSQKETPSILSKTVAKPTVSKPSPETEADNKFIQKSITESAKNKTQPEYLKPKILIVDDEIDFIEGLKERLIFEGYEVLTASDGHIGLELVQRELPDLVLMDVMMPKIDGYMVCRLLKFDKKYEDIPIIVLSARGLHEDKEIGLSSGADEYFTKPIDFELLLKKIRELLCAETVEI